MKEDNAPDLANERFMAFRDRVLVEAAPAACGSAAASAAMRKIG